jgi:flagellar basal-body rod protein FlgB
MELGQLSIFKMMNKKMDWLAQRQKVLSENIANADTPRFRPGDLKPLDFNKAFKTALKAEHSALQPQATTANHLPGTKPIERWKTQPEGNKDLFELAPNKNGVILEEQAMKMAETSMQYNMLASVYTKQVGMIKTAIGRGA